MFADYTVKGVCAMLAADPTATEEERSRVAAAMRPCGGSSRAGGFAECRARAGAATSSA